MIFQITDGFVEIVTGQQLSDICCGMMQAGQYISCDGLVYDRIRQAVTASSTRIHLSFTLFICRIRIGPSFMISLQEKEDLHLFLQDICWMRR